MRSWYLTALVVLAGCGRTPPDLFVSGNGDGPPESGTTTTLDPDTGPSSHSGPQLTDTSADGTSTTNDSSTGPASCIDVPQLCTVELSLRRAVDILFVVDNSGSMGGDQATLVQSFASFVEVLEGQQVGANYRIGVTTTAGDGVLKATSCLSRLNDFIFHGVFGDVDERQRGCLDHCAIEDIPLPNPWVEKSDGQTNLPPGVGMAQALQCVGPPGINGPGFERPLESMRAALLDDPSGFIRNDALLAVIFVTDEADCSTDDDSEFWLKNFGQVFWTTPERATSGVCWNAGVTCVGGPGVYDDCFAVDKGQNGLPTMDEDEAVLYPVQRYIDTLTQIAAQKQLEGGQGEVLVAALAGVPLDYPDTGVVVYADSPLPDFNIEYGMGPGCGHGTEAVQDPPGIPPVRLRQFAEAFATDERNVYSICSDDYAVALTQIADALGELNEHACISGCVVDADPGTPALDPDCTLVERFADGTPDQVVPPCLVFDDGWDFPGDDVHTCFRALTDVGESTTTPFDDMTAQCVTIGSNVELDVERREGVPIAAGTSVAVSCQLEAPVGVTCDEV
ncbi:vWA domain-containing protein [Paraliomyxa miuraensis]|uniref:vWA domain-containing protein n=1 Tax=Paraliomyxa miuraensis TaxID=376150 RepID=UPI00224E42FB|nr:vWA domain-containing protein [Paraliomyxa miuraensis]MCX4239276.1 VWA domain-containing protein [Paraliomyxa miuraensis]